MSIYHFSRAGMALLMGVVIGLIGWGALPAKAQESPLAWVQIEAHSSLTTAQDRARAYASELPDVNGFALGGGWYGVALGPYASQDAQRVLQTYLAEGVIPTDSYIRGQGVFGQQFWPVGAGLQTNATPPAPQPQEESAEQTAAAPTPPEPDETPQEARRSEAELNREERDLLQIALKWAGYYNSAIDGAFGPGTRRAMSEWQAANGFEATGVLTTAQRAALLAQYNAVLEGIDLQLVQDVAAGIEIKIPKGVVAFDRYEPPFAHYTATGDLDARVLLISQEGDRATLFGLYDIMQTLEIVPLDGPRERTNSSFRLIGESATMISQTEARLVDGQIKGFTLIWPAGDEERRRRVLGEMQQSFARLEGVLDATAGVDGEQRIDLVSGLQIRTPRLSRSGIFVDDAGTVVTTTQAVQGCSRITLDGDQAASVVTQNADLGIAVLRPEAALSPIAIAQFAQSAPRLNSEIVVAGFPYQGVLGAPSLTFGTLSDLRGLAGETELARLSLVPLEGDAGGPVLDQAGRVMGMLLPRPETGPQWPEDVSFALRGAAIAQVLEQSEMTLTQTDATGAMPVETLRRQASGMTVLVSCWD